jgi:G2/mitotic-specific cyclin 1/2
MAHLGPAQRAPVTQAKKAVVPAPVKAGAKRTALGGVVGNGVKEGEMDRKPGEYTSSYWKRKLMV